MTTKPKPTNLKAGSFASKCFRHRVSVAGASALVNNTPRQIRLTLIYSYLDYCSTKVSSHTFLLLDACGTYQGRAFAEETQSVASQMKWLELQCLDETCVRVPTVPIAQCLETFAMTSPGFSNLLRTTVSNASGCALTLLLYNDGIIPGNVLSPDPARKSTVFYISFAEFGNHLQSENLWCPIAVIRDSILHSIPNGLAGFFRQLMKSLLPPASSLLQGGEPMNIAGEAWLLKIKKFEFFADEKAIKDSFLHKGASGLRCCFKCKNVLTQSHLADDYFVHISEGVFSKFDQQSNTDIFEVADYLAGAVAAGASKTRVEELQKFSGLNYAPSSILFDPDVRSHLGPDMVWYDPMHIYFSGGLLGYEISLLCHSITEAHKAGLINFSCSDFADLVAADWKCSAKPSVLHSSCSSRRRAFKLAIKDRCNASMLLMLWPLLDFIARTVLAGHACIQKQVDSFMALCATVRTICRAKRKPDLAVTIQQKQSSHMQSFIMAYTKSSCRPKHHFQFHIQKQIAESRVMLDCFACERKHRLFKAVCNALASNNSFEQSVLVRMLSSQREQLATMEFDHRFANNVVSHGPVSVHLKDCLIIPSDQCFIIEELVASNGIPYARGRLWQLVTPAANMFSANQVVGHFSTRLYHEKRRSSSSLTTLCQCGRSHASAQST